MSEEAKEIIEEVEEAIVETIKAPIKIVGKLFDWITGN